MSPPWQFSGDIFSLRLPCFAPTRNVLTTLPIFKPSVNPYPTQFNVCCIHKCVPVWCLNIQTLDHIRNLEIGDSANTKCAKRWKIVQFFYICTYLYFWIRCNEKKIIKRLWVNCASRSFFGTILLDFGALRIILKASLSAKY